MTSIAQVSRTVTTLFEHDAVELGKQYGLRQRTMTFTKPGLGAGLGMVEAARGFPQRAFALCR